MGKNAQEFKLKISIQNPNSENSAVGHTEVLEKKDSEKLQSCALSERDKISSGAQATKKRTETDTEYRYHYGRIVVAASVLVAFFIVIAWGSVQFMGKKDPLTHEHTSSSKESSTMPILDQLNTESPLASKAAIESQVSSEDMTATLGVEQLSGESEQSLSEQSLTAVRLEQSKEELEQRQVSAGKSKVVTQTLTQSIPIVHVYQPDIVSRAMLSPKLVDKNPTGEIASPIQIGRRTIIRVYFSTTLDKVYGKRYFHVWYLNDQEKARVPMLVTSSSWRANSSKYINKAILGSWQVKLEDLNGQILAETKFEVLP